MLPIGQPILAEALQQLWSRFLPLLEERLAVLESAEAALVAGNLSLAQRAEANAAAHKLAGVLGTFGLTKGTVLASELEILYSGEPETDPADAGQLRTTTAQLRAMVENRKSGSGS